MIGRCAAVVVLGGLALGGAPVSSAAWAPSADDRRAVTYWNELGAEARRNTCDGHARYPTPPEERTPYWHLLQNQCPSLGDVRLELATFGGADAEERLAARRSGAYYCGLDSTDAPARFTP